MSATTAIVCRQAMQREFCDHRADVAQHAVLRVHGGADDFEVVDERGEQVADFFGRILQVVVHRDDGIEPCRANPAEQCVVLSVISH